MARTTIGPSVQLPAMRDDIGTNGGEAYASRRGRLRRVPKRQVASELVAEHLRWQIFDGELRPGDRIIPERVAEELSVSRLPVREALAALARDGLVIMAPHQRAQVGDFDAEVLRDHFEIVGSVQVLAAVHLAERNDRDVMARLEAIVDGLERSDSAVESYDLTMEFHRIINVEGGSSRQRSVLRSLGRMLPQGLFVEIPGASESERTGERRILNALRRGDPAAIRDACLSVQRERAELIISHLRETGVFSASPNERRTVSGDRKESA
jgi:DNA-binding GntR family transcriptional regulator